MQIFSPKHKTCRNISAWENISAGVSLLEEFQKSYGIADKIGPQSAGKKDALRWRG